MIALNLPGIFGIAAAALALMLLLKVVSSPATDRTGKFLLLTFIAGLLGMAVNSLYFLLGMHLVWPHGMFLWLLSMAWIGPSFWFYTARVLGLGVSPSGWPATWHWIPGIAIQVGVLPFLVQPATAKLDFLYSVDGKWVFAGIYLFIYLQIAVYLLRCQRALVKHRAQIAVTEEKEELRKDLAWITIVIYGFAAFLVLDGVLPHLRITPPGTSYIVAMALYLCIIVAVFHASAHGKVYPFVSNKARSDPKYANSALRDDSAVYYLGKLERLMHDEQPHLDGELSLDKLAALLKIHPHHLSQVLNDHLRKNFYDFINEHRIAQAKKLLVEQAELPVVDVAIACGYNNKNSFYNSFRRFVGMTPTQFRQQAANATSPSPSRG